MVDVDELHHRRANLSKALSQEFGPHGIRINSVSPGPVGTDFWLGEHGVAAAVAKAKGVDADTAREAIVAGMGGIPKGRFSTPEEVATLVVFLAHRERDRLRVRDRRRPDQDDVGTASPQMSFGAAGSLTCIIPVQQRRR